MIIFVWYLNKIWNDYFGLISDHINWSDIRQQKSFPLLVKSFKSPSIVSYLLWHYIPPRRPTPTSCPPKKRSRCTAIRTHSGLIAFLTSVRMSRNWWITPAPFKTSSFYLLLLPFNLLLLPPNLLLLPPNPLILPFNFLPRFTQNYLWSLESSRPTQ